MDGQAGSEGRILLCLDAQRLQEISSFQVGKLHEGIQLPSIWLWPRPSQIHKDIQASSSIPPKEGNVLDYIHKQQNNPESESAGSDKRQGTVIFILQCLGFVIDWEKSHLVPTQMLEYLRMLIASVTMTLSLPEKKLVAIIQKCQCLLEKTVVTIREVSELIGVLSVGV